MSTRVGRSRDIPMFANSEGWRADPIAAFEDWAVNARQASANKNGEKRPLLSHSSIKVYAAMWASFVESAKARRIDPCSMGADEIARFLSEEKADIGHQHRKRYARVISRALADARSELPLANKVSKPEKKADDEPTPFLDQAERAAVFAILAQPCLFDTPSQIARSKARALCALMLGGGLKPGEALNASSVNCALFAGEDSIRVEQKGAPKSRVAYFDPRARPALSSWISWREAIGGGLFFPAQMGAYGAVADYARAFLGVKRLLADAGAKAGGERASPQTLRNSYGAALIEAGKSDELVRAYMGFSRLEFARRFVYAHARWVERRQAGNPVL